MTWNEKIQAQPGAGTDATRWRSWRSTALTFGNFMNQFTRRGIGVLALGGGFLGMVVCSQYLFSDQLTGFVSHIIVIAFILLYGYGVWAGMKFLENSNDSVHLIVYYWMQVPVLLSPIVSYKFTSGLHLAVLAKLFGFNFMFRFGSDWAFLLLAKTDFQVGVNILALVVALYLMKKRKPNQSLEVTPLADASSAPQL